MDTERKTRLLEWWDELNPEQQRDAMIDYANWIDRLTIDLMVAKNNLLERVPSRASASDIIPEFPKIEGVSLELETQLLSWWVLIHSGPRQRRAALQWVAVLLQERSTRQEEIEALRENNKFLREWVAQQIETIVDLQDQLEPKG